MLQVRPIECSFRKIPNYPEEGFKDGRFSGSFHWDIKEFSDKKWVVLGYLEVDWPSIIREENLTQEDIVTGCLKFLNIVPERKKRAKKDPRPKYGLLESYKADFKVKNGKAFIIAQLKTSDQANSHFWGEGQNWNGGKILRKRGRPPKIKVENNDE